jgi:hypothetical protein
MRPQLAQLSRWKSIKPAPSISPVVIPAPTPMGSKTHPQFESRGADGFSAFAMLTMIQSELSSLTAGAGSGTFLDAEVN